MLGKLDELALEEIPGFAEQMARENWNRKRVYMPVIGTIRTSEPRFGSGLLFPYMSIGCEMSEKTQLFCDSYNNLINDMARNLGTPEWAPVNHDLDLESSLHILSQTGKTFLEYQPTSENERWKVDHTLYKLGKLRAFENPWKPRLYGLSQDQKTLVLGGHFSMGISRVITFDLGYPEWLRSFRLYEWSHPNLPWPTSFRVVSLLKRIFSNRGDHP